MDHDDFNEDTTCGILTEAMAAKDTLATIRTDAFWQTATLTEIDRIREEIRGRMHFPKREMKAKAINITDAVLFGREGERFTAESNLEGYYERASRHVTENEDKPALHKWKVWAIQGLQAVWMLSISLAFTLQVFRE